MSIKTNHKKNNKKLKSFVIENLSPEADKFLHQIEEKQVEDITTVAEQIISESAPPKVERRHQLNPRRIALLSWESLHSISVGGIGAHVTQLAAALERQGHEVHVFTRMGWQNHAQYDCIHGVHYHRVPYVGHSDFVEDVNNMCRSLVTSVFSAEDYMGAHFDIVHAHDWLTSNAMVWIKEGKGRKGILTIHSTEYGRCGNNFYDGPSSRIRDQERHGTFCANKVIAVSTALKNEIMWMYNLPDWKVRSIHNGVNFHDFNSWIDPGEVKKRYGIGPLDPMVLFSGRMTYQKGPDLLVEAIPFILHYFHNAKFVFAGDGDLRGAVEDRARQLGVSHATRFVGYQNAWNLRELYKACECVCVPSRNEPFGIVILEAWSSGKPVIASVNGGPSELIWHDVTGYKIYPKPDSIAWGIGTLFGNFEHARWMGSKGREAVEKLYSWDHIAEQTLSFYNS